MTRAPLLLLLPLLGCHAPEQGAATAFTPVPLDSLRPQWGSDFERTDTVAPWSRSREEGTAHTGRYALLIAASDEYVPLVSVRAGDVGEDVVAVRASAWVFPGGTPGRLRWSVQCTDSTGRMTNHLGRIIRPEELPQGAWTDLHGQVDLPHAAGPQDRLTVMLWNEGRTAIFLDDALVTFVSAEIPGRNTLGPEEPIDTAAY